MKAPKTHIKNLNRLLICALLSFCCLQLYAAISIDYNSPKSLEIVETGEEKLSIDLLIDIDLSEDDLHIISWINETYSLRHCYKYVFMQRHYLTNLDSRDYPPEF